MRSLLAITGLFCICLALSGCALFPPYAIWEQEQYGKAELAKAVSTRQIKTLEAKAKKESSQFEAEAEVVRAQGVAKANKIIGESLKGNEAYLHYLWVNQLENNKNAVIYVPTETNLPLMLKQPKEVN